MRRIFFYDFTLRNLLYRPASLASLDTKMSIAIYLSLTCTALHATSAELLNEVHVRILELVLNIQFLQDETENLLRYIDTLESYNDLL
jgi:hypothetical protein